MAVVGAGLVGLSLAYELACLGAAVTVIDAGHPGRATDAGAGILSPATSAEADERLWPFLRQAGAHYPALLRRMAVRRRRRRRDRATAAAASSPSACASHEDEWFAPFADVVLRRAPGRGGRDHARGGRLALPPARPGAPRAARARFGAGRRPGHGGRAARRPRRRAAWRSWRARRTAWWPGSRQAGAHVDAVEVEGHQNVACDAVAVAGGAWTAAVGEWLGTRLPVGPTKGQIVHLGVGADTGDWPIVQPLLTHYLVPWPGGRVACGGTFEAGAGFSVERDRRGPPRAAARVPDRRARAGRRDLPRDAGRAAARPRPTTAPSSGRLPGWGNAWVATGHGANGLLQGPYSARVLAHAMAGVGPAVGRGAAAGLVRSRPLRLTRGIIHPGAAGARGDCGPC